MGVLYSKIPESIKKDIIDPYISIKDNEARISLRIIDSQDGLRRNDLIKQINYDLKNKLKLKKKNLNCWCIRFYLTIYFKVYLNLKYLHWD